LPSLGFSIAPEEPAPPSLSEYAADDAFLIFKPKSEIPSPKIDP
jgi:hypothetical protein